MKGQMRKKIYPIIKSKICESVVLANLPENYKEYIYIEPFCGSATVLLNKEPSKQEFINDINTEIINLLRRVRDVPGVKELKKNNLINNKLKDFAKNVKKVSERLKQVFISNKDPLHIIKTFNNKESLIYLNLIDNFMEPKEIGRLVNYRGKMLILSDKELVLEGWNSITDKYILYKNY